MITLSPDERQRFAAYCEEQADTLLGQVNALALLPLRVPINDQLISNRKLQAALYAAMARELRAWGSVCL